MLLGARPNHIASAAVRVSSFFGLHYSASSSGNEAIIPRLNLHMRFRPGRRLGPYEILAGVGAGGMGEVYKARDTRLARTVALKVLLPHVAADPVFRERFKREARAASALDHPHICALYDIGQDQSVQFLVLQYLDGETLADRLAKGPPPLDQALKHAREIADALDKAHRAGIVHRDLAAPAADGILPGA